MDAMSGGSGIFNRMYETTREFLINDYAQNADESYIEFYQRFAVLEMESFGEALDAIEKNYLSHIAEYFYDFIRLRTKSYRKYIEGLKK